jgi:hypothetical protein
MPEFHVDFVVRLIVARCNCLDQATLAEIRNRLDDSPAGAAIDSAGAGRSLHRRRGRNPAMTPAGFARELRALSRMARFGKQEFFRRLGRLCDEEPIFAERIAARLEPHREAILHAITDKIARGEVDAETITLWRLHMEGLVRH